MENIIPAKKQPSSIETCIHGEKKSHGERLTRLHHHTVGLSKASTYPKMFGQFEDRKADAEHGQELCRLVQLIHAVQELFHDKLRHTRGRGLSRTRPARGSSVCRTLVSTAVTTANIKKVPMSWHSR
jgi:hypothetical protein